MSSTTRLASCSDRQSRAKPLPTTVQLLSTHSMTMATNSFCAVVELLAIRTFRGRTAVEAVERPTQASSAPTIRELESHHGWCGITPVGGCADRVLCAPVTQLSHVVHLGTRARTRPQNGSSSVSLHEGLELERYAAGVVRFRVNDTDETASTPCAGRYTSESGARRIGPEGAAAWSGTPPEPGNRSRRSRRRVQRRHRASRALIRRRRAPSSTKLTMQQVPGVGSVKQSPSQNRGTKP